jgi:protocatechuate 3,4-dioxygenase beta subunit
VRAALAISLALVAACSAPGQPAAPASTAAATAAATADAAASPASTAAATAGLPSAPDCRAPATPTTAQTEGPFFKAGSPERASLLGPGITGTTLVVTGFVLTRSCRPIAGAKLDFWQANDKGEYDNAGFTLRGHLFTDAQGRYRLETIAPAEYPGRTPHIHVKVTPPGGATLTSQLYLPDQARNSSDSIFRPELVMKLERGTTPWVGRFDFVLDLP